jgi:hypothetical protein
LFLMLGRQPAELRIALQSPFLLPGRHVLVTTQPVARVAGLSPYVLGLTRRRLLAAGRALLGLVSLPRCVGAISLRSAGSGKGKHGGYASRRQPLREMFRSFQFLPALPGSRGCDYSVTYHSPTHQRPRIKGSP